MREQVLSTATELILYFGVSKFCLGCGLEFHGFVELSPGRLMRFVKPLSHDTIHLLQRIYKHSQLHRVRQRAHCVLLSHRGYPVTTLLDIFQVTRITLYHWLEAWEQDRLIGLYDQKGKGCKPELSPAQKEQVKQWAKVYPKRLGKSVELVQKNFGLSISKRTIQRALKERNFSWRRIRRIPKGQPDPTEYQLKKQELKSYSSRLFF